MNLSDEQAKRIGAELEAGSKIGAIKLYREFTGQGLKESKDAIEALISGLIQREPEKYAKLNQQAQGCSVKAASVLIIAIGALIFFVVTTS